MLVLGRKTGQQVIIGNDIEITVCRVKGGTVKLGIKAPRSVSILRSELHDERQEEQRSQPDHHSRLPTEPNSNRQRQTLHFVAPSW